MNRIWTPTWVLVSGGACLWTLAIGHWIIDLRQRTQWAFPLVVIGANSIAEYLIAHLFATFIAKSRLTHLGAGVFCIGGSADQPVLHGAATLTVMWLLLFWMWRRKLLLKV